MLFGLSQITFFTSGTKLWNGIQLFVKTIIAVTVFRHKNVVLNSFNSCLICNTAIVFMIQVIQMRLPIFLMKWC